MCQVTVFNKFQISFFELTSNYSKVKLESKVSIQFCAYIYFKLNRTYFKWDPAEIFFNVGPPKEDIFSGHLLSPVFQTLVHITITNFHFDHLKAARLYSCL